MDMQKYLILSVLEFHMKVGYENIEIDELNTSNDNDVRKAPGTLKLTCY